MASFMEELWNSIFTPGASPTLLVATNTTFAALQFLLLALLLATYSVHFVVLSFLSGGLWYSINWFAREVRKEHEEKERADRAYTKERSPEPGSDTETEANPSTLMRKAASHPSEANKDALQPEVTTATDSAALRRRRSLGDSSGYVSTDSEWEKVSDREAPP